MKPIHFSPAPVLVGMTGLITLAVGMTAAIAAEPKVEKHETVIIKMVHTGDKQADQLSMLPPECNGKKPVIESGSESNEADGAVKRSHIIICNKDDGTALNNADMVKRLEAARTHVEGISDLSSEAKAKALASLDAEIARLKSAQ